MYKCESWPVVWTGKALFCVLSFLFTRRRAAAKITSTCSVSQCARCLFIRLCRGQSTCMYLPCRNMTKRSLWCCLSWNLFLFWTSNLVIGFIVSLELDAKFSVPGSSSPMATRHRAELVKPFVSVFPPLLKAEDFPPPFHPHLAWMVVRLRCWQAPLLSSLRLFVSVCLLVGWRTKDRFGMHCSFFFFLVCTLRPKISAVYHVRSKQILCDAFQRKNTSFKCHWQPVFKISFVTGTKQYYCVTATHADKNYHCGGLSVAHLTVKLNWHLWTQDTSHFVKNCCSFLLYLLAPEVLSIYLAESSHIGTVVSTAVCVVSCTDEHCNFCQRQNSCVVPGWSALVVSFHSCDGRIRARCKIPEYKNKLISAKRDFSVSPNHQLCCCRSSLKRRHRYHFPKYQRAHSVAGFSGSLHRQDQQSKRIASLSVCFSFSSLFRNPENLLHILWLWLQGFAGVALQ